jgi:hypothetical protein
VRTSKSKRYWCSGQLDRHCHDRSVVQLSSTGASGYKRQREEGDSAPGELQRARRVYLALLAGGSKLQEGQHIPLLLINWRGGVPPGYRNSADTTKRRPKVVSLQPPALSRELSARRRAALMPQRTPQVLRHTGGDPQPARAAVTSPSEGSAQITERMERVELTGSFSVPENLPPRPHSAHASPYGFLAALRQRRDGGEGGSGDGSRLVSERCRPVALRTMHDYFNTLNGDPLVGARPQTAGPPVRAPVGLIGRY